MEVLLIEYERDVEYGVKVEVDIDAKTADIYINGILKASGILFINPTTFLDNILIMTGGRDQGEMFLNPVRIYKGYIVYEKFLTCMPGNIPSGWVADNSGGCGLLSGVEVQCGAGFLQLQDGKHASRKRCFSGEGIFTGGRKVSHGWKYHEDNGSDIVL